uniref:Periplasmic beta-glucosidase n=1 Tax=uncultured bacterium 20 TaxID=1748270 RepID=A0A0U3JBP5_9BACT|nr:glycosyl hydrolase family [uncultured bacterium 20]
MTLEEKIGQVTQFFFFTQFMKPEMMEAGIRDGKVGSLLFVTDAALINRFQRIAVEQSRLHIPLLFGFDVIHGLHTIFPVPLAMASSWDPSLVERAQTVAAREASAVGIRWTFAPMVDIARDPRWGRIVEGAGEDPYLGSRIAAAQVRGFQGTNVADRERVLACVKHFAGYGAGSGGRDYDSAFIADAELHNVYLPPFKAAVDAGAGSLMSAYMDLNDVPATGNAFLLQDVLRRDWGFKGFVVSDAEAVGNLITHGFAADKADAAARALTAGVDMEMTLPLALPFLGADVGRAYASSLAKLVEEGRVTAAQLDGAVRRILEAKIRLGLFENPYVDEARAASVRTDPEHRRLARMAAQRSAVLLRNDGNLLPLAKADPKVSTIAVIGPLADSKRDIRGSWSFADDVERAVTVFEGVRAKVGPGVKVEHAPGVDIARAYPSPFVMISGPRPPAWSEDKKRAEFEKAVALARSSDLTVVVLGEHEEMSGEAASKSTIDLPGRQRELLDAVLAAGKPVVLVLVNGRPLDITWASTRVPSILEAWHPGTEGGNAIADLLFGDANPGGKLPVTWPRSLGQVPIFYAHNLTQAPETAPDFTSRYWDVPTSPLYPFGYGLSYTTFAYSNLRVSRPEAKVGETVEVSVDVENTGTRAGDEVAQLYVHQRVGSASRPVRELKGFERVTLAPREKKTVRFALGRDELRYWSSAAKAWVQEPATFDVWAGGDSTASLTTTLRVVR